MATLQDLKLLLAKLIVREYSLKKQIDDLGFSNTEIVHYKKQRLDIKTVSPNKEMFFPEDWIAKNLPSDYLWTYGNFYRDNKKREYVFDIFMVVKTKVKVGLDKNTQKLVVLEGYNCLPIKIKKLRTDYKVLWEGVVNGEVNENEEIDYKEFVSIVPEKFGLWDLNYFFSQYRERWSRHPQEGIYGSMFDTKYYCKENEIRKLYSDYEKCCNEIEKVKQETKNVEERESWFSN